eukprot:1087946-Amphidinium_carterae.1
MDFVGSKEECSFLDMFIAGGATKQGIKQGSSSLSPFSSVVGELWTPPHQGCIGECSAFIVH